LTKSVNNDNIRTMKLTTKVRYAVIAMCDLAVNYDPDRPVQVKDIASRQHISVLYIEQLFNKLKKADLIRSMRGPRGGYILSQKPSKIKIGDIFRVVEGRIALVGCVDTGDSKVSCAMSGKCSTKSLWAKLSRLIENVLDSTTLADLCLTNRRGT
jgi:Rrf2 family transcriptional regulator, cysteine metabolism repressor